MAITNCSPNIQAKLNELYSIGRYQAPAGAIKMAMSPENGAQVQAKMIRQDGKNSQYSIEYVKATCDTPTDDFDCTGAGTDAGALTECINFSGFNTLGMPTWKNIGIQSLRDLNLTTPLDAFSAHLWDNMQKIKSAVDVAYVTYLCAESGCIKTGVETKTLSLLNALGAPNFGVDSTILADFSDAGFGGIQPLLLGNRQVLKFSNAQGAAGLANSGLNLNQMTRFQTFYDNNVTDATCAPTTPGNDAMLALLPGISNMLSFSNNAGLFASRQSPSRWDNIDPTSLLREGETYLHTVIEDPETGMLFDLNIKYEAGCQKWQYHLSTLYKFLNLPVTGCADSCFNGIVKYDICPETAVDCTP